MKILTLLFFIFVVISVRDEVNVPCIDRKTLTQNDYKPLLQFNGDTSSYLLNNFVGHQERYINKPFREFFKQLELPVKRFNPEINGPDMPEGCYGIKLSFYSPEVTAKKINEKKEPAILVVIWKNLIPREPSIDFGRLRWPADQIMKYYMSRNEIIKNITYVSYYHKK